MIMRIPRETFSDVERVEIRDSVDRYEEIIALIAALIPLTRDSIRQVQITGTRLQEDVLKLIQTLLASEEWEQEKTIEYLSWLVFSKKFHVVSDRIGTFILPVDISSQKNLAIAIVDSLDDSILRHLPNKHTIVGIRKGRGSSEIIETIETVYDVIKVSKVMTKSRNSPQKRILYGKITPLKKPKTPENEHDQKLFFRKITITSPIYYETHEVGDAKIMAAVDIIRREFYFYLKYPNKEIFLKQLGSAIIDVQESPTGEFYEISFLTNTAEPDVIRVRIDKELHKLLTKISKKYRIAYALSK
ncbi:hypothetical protein [Thermococcus prieurii]